MADTVVTNSNAAYVPGRHTEFDIDQNDSYAGNRSTESVYAEVNENPYYTEAEDNPFHYSTNHAYNRNLPETSNNPRGYELTELNSGRNNEDNITLKKDTKGKSNGKKCQAKGKTPYPCIFLAILIGTLAFLAAAASIAYGVLQILEITAQLADQTDKINIVQTRLNDTSKEIDMLETRLIVVEQNIDTLDNRYNYSERKINVLEAQLNDSRGEIDMLKLQLSATRHEILQLLNSTTDIDVGGLDNQLHTSQIIELQNEVINITQQIQMLRNQLNGIDSSTVQPPDNSINELQQQLDNANNQIQILQAFQTDQQNTTQALLMDVQNLQADIELLKSFHPGISSNDPATSCPENGPTGLYWIQTSSLDSPIQVFCDMDRTNCGCNNNGGGWMRIVNFDMTDPQQNCPDEFLFFFQANPRTFRLCRRPSGSVDCVGITYATHGVQYTEVCGRVIGYQFHTTDAFRAYHLDNTLTIDSPYVDGVSLTHGQSPRQHIWTFASAFGTGSSDDLICPCIRASTPPFTGTVPPFIGENYFCDTGGGGINQFQSNSALWEGEGCTGANMCCLFNTPPWFCTQLPQPTTDDIELRICADETTGAEGTPIEQVELYVR